MLDVTALSRASTAFSVLEFVNILGMLTQILFVLGLKVKAYGSARIHKVIGVKIVFKRADYTVFLFTEVASSHGANIFPIPWWWLMAAPLFCMASRIVA